MAETTIFSVALSSIFALEKYAKNLNLLPLKERLVAILSETCALISRTNVAEKGMTVPNLSETYRLFWLHSSVFALGKTP